ncbi:hemerythrin domain-containing protein [Rhodococcus sp. 5A-K4]|uniref:hemerythrin domain-containing protein n=1 Tax=Rhodococcus sp. 5A-K4 TaxID=3384442 RepID=UPI0038D3F9C5
MNAPHSHNTATVAGLRMIEQLRQVHEPLRADIEVLENALQLLSDETTDLTRIPEMIDNLTIADFVWQLRVNCDFYCKTLTLHHTIEDQRMFPVMTRNFPELAPAVERLQAEHKLVGEIVSEAKRASLALSTESSTVNRAQTAISELADHMQSHLDFEEATLFPYFRRMDRDWHYG